MRYNLKFWRVFLKKRHPGKLHFTFFSPKKLARLFMLKEVKPSPDSKIENFLHLITCCRYYDILAKTRSRTTTAITFSRQNDAGSRMSNTQYWENLLFVVVIVSESKVLDSNVTQKLETVLGYLRRGRKKTHYYPISNLCTVDTKFRLIFIHQEVAWLTLSPEYPHTNSPDWSHTRPWRISWENLIKDRSIFS